MKFIGINGSPNKSNTYYMIQTILEASGADFEIIQLSEKDINPCYDCKGCHLSHRCQQMDDTQEIHERILTADALVLGSPTYFDNVSGIMKNFMDRCLPFCSTLFSKELVGKPTALVTVGNFKEYLQLNENNYSKYEKEEEESVLNCLTNMQSFSKIIGLNIIGSVFATQSNPQAKEQELIKLGKKLFTKTESITKKR